MEHLIRSIGFGIAALSDAVVLLARSEGLTEGAGAPGLRKHGVVFDSVGVVAKARGVRNSLQGQRHISTLVGR